MIREHAECDIDVLLFGQTFALRRDGAGVSLARKRRDLGEERSEDISIVVRRLSAEVFEAFGRSVTTRHPFEAHSSIDVFGGKRGKRAVSVRVELDENS